MRTLVAATVTVVVVAITGGCAGDSNGSDDRQGTGSIDDSTPQDPETPATPSPRSGDAAVVDSEACDEVRGRIEAFNVGEFDETDKHFQAALPPAEEQDDGSVLASELIEAVRCYRNLVLADGCRDSQHRAHPLSAVPIDGPTVHVGGGWAQGERRGWGRQPRRWQRSAASDL